MKKSVQRFELTYVAASELVSKALEYAREKSWEVAVAVVDPHGFLVAFGRTDGVAPPIGDFAIDKAYTAGTLRKSTEAFGERMASSPTLSLGLSNRQRFMPWGGGLAIFEEENCLGGIGVSGAQSFEDIECATAAVVSLSLTAR